MKITNPPAGHDELSGVSTSDHHTIFTAANARAAAVEDTAYASGWNGDTTHAPSQNAVYDKIEALPIPTVASQAALHAETDQDTYAPPDVIKYSPGVAKAWMKNSGATTPVAEDAYNCAITDEGVGVRGYEFGDDFANDDYVSVGSAYGPAGDNLQACIFGQNILAVGSIDCLIRTSASAANLDLPNAVVFFGEAAA